MAALGGIVLILIGLVGVLAPEVSWWLETGWRFKDAEPSEFALVMNRIGGGVCIVFGIIFLLMQFTV